ncbi:MAG: response regulator [Planctomycetes bacterium]|nr:response regulator [Planctomycetota bacterium]
MSANILIVDDSAIMRQMIKRTLAMSRLDIDEVYEASNGIEALAKMSEHSVAVVLVDINMPVMNGAQLISRMRVDERLRDVPLIVASTEGSETRIQELLDSGARGYVRKPFQPEQLRDVLAPILGVCEGAEVGTDEDDSAF